MFKITLKKTVVGISIICLIYFGLLLFPFLLFANKLEYKQCTVFSDRPIDNNIIPIIDKALQRIGQSELYIDDQHFRIYICNDLWRFGIFTQGHTLAGAVTQYNLTRDIFFRPCDIANNKIIPPKSWYFADNPFSFSDRPLTYYFAHEMTHVLQSKYTGRGSWRYPTWLTEGYADYIGKGANFDFTENLNLLHENAPELDPAKGLYRNYHLKVAYLLDSTEWTIQQLYEQPPKEKILEEQILKIPRVENTH